VRYAAGSTPTDYTYTGQYSHTADFGLMYYNARLYDPYLNRFAQADTIIPGPGNSQAWDRYSYSFNNPVRYADPSGHFIVETIDCTQLSCSGDPNPGGGGRKRDDDKEPETIITALPTTTLSDLPSLRILHPLESNVISQVPIYDYSYYPRKLIGYRVTYYAYDDADFSFINFVLPTGPFSWASVINSFIIKPLVTPGINNLASVGINLSCPVCGLVLNTLSTLESVNSAVTLDTHLSTHDVYFYEQTVFITPLDEFPYPKIR
jgi:RHS repeat-associated protein